MGMVLQIRKQEESWVLRLFRVWDFKNLFYKVQYLRSKFVLKTRDNNVFNKYWFGYPCLVSVRKIWFDKGSLRLKQGKFEFFSFSYNVLNTFCGNVNVLSVHFIAFYSILDSLWFILCIVLYHWLTRIWKGKSLKLIPDRSKIGWLISYLIIVNVNSV